ncbi:MAG: CopG family antitoxin [Thermodesulfobacteriota bacterium]
MKEDKPNAITSISKARSIEEASEFWDNHSLANYWEQTHGVEIEVMAKQRRRVAIDPDVYSKIVAQARLRGILPETLVNAWLTERLKEITES